MSFIYELKSVPAHYARAEGSLLSEDDRPVIGYAKYTVSLPQKNKKVVNLLFAHGTGMNKSIWRYHIEKLYELAAGNLPWQLGTVVAFDAINHGDSMVANAGKLGVTHNWTDNAKDALCVVKNEPELSSLNLESITISIGHSLGGFTALYAAYLEPIFFESIIAIEPVISSKELLIPADQISPEQYAYAVSSSYKMLKKLDFAIQDQFEDEADFVEFMTKYSFYKNIPQKVLKPFLEDEMIAGKDADGEDIITVKACKKQQMVAYIGARHAITNGMPILRFINIPVTHVMGSKSTWNDPDFGRSYIRSEIPNCRGVEIENGEHLVNCEMPDETIAVIIDHINEAVQRANKAGKQFPATLTDKQRDEIFEARYDNIFKEYEQIVAEAKKARAKSKL
ncbi:hypothetical protein BABINDRAFT_160484 [Babjeviella inositovora NRRL Y-12698]|uniref:AB hydrolase-1 domain-containing protein n=1 Tax=Babjeviella inositovora NRRL Y-12698 TaxID=984486 RepID=A0A1E3QVI0_9ASCO|nr:uncharacterized protein BABINDRAFT_160484 [Babjeviella inositovora NRRL Y-12698]ODQ81072.1 hypothetical protein BABINDRAFT_160484 [Babjeviella inositovora NRRL Y-12698]